MPILMPSFNNPPAYMGFVGFLRYNVGGNQLIVRATSCDIKLSQDNSVPEVVDGRYDRTVIQYGPFQVGGSAAFPALYGRDSVSGLSPAGILLGYTLVRNPTQATLYSIPIDVKYTTESTGYTYENSIINTFKFAVAQSDIVSITTEVIATNRNPISQSGRSLALLETDTPQTRTVQWNDAFVLMYVGSSNQSIVDGRFVRSFEVTFNNNAERYYTLNGTLFPQAVAPRKRDITGTATFLGRIPELSNQAFTNTERCFEQSRIRFGYNVPTTSGCYGALDVTLPNVVFQPEEIALTNDLFETTVAFRSLPDTQTQLTDGIDGIINPATGAAM